MDLVKDWGPASVKEPTSEFLVVRLEGREVFLEIQEKSWGAHSSLTLDVATLTG